MDNPALDLITLKKICKELQKELAFSTPDAKKVEKLADEARWLAECLVQRGQEAVNEIIFKEKVITNQDQLDRIEAKIDQLNHLMVALLDVLDDGEEFDDGERDQTQPL